MKPVFRMRRSLTQLFMILILLMPFLCAGCEAGERLETVELRVGNDIYRVEIAQTDDQRRTGLMHRETLGEFEGMLFVFERDQHLSFWMKNTTVPLSIGYISRDGTLREIYDMHPLSERAVESAYSVRYALELPQGAFEKSGARVGDIIEIPQQYR